MGREWKKNQKAINGNPIDYRDNVVGNVVSLSGLVTPTTLNPIANGVSRVRAPRDGQIDFVLANVTPTVASGAIEVAVYNAGTLIASGTINSSLTYLEKMYGYSSQNAGEPKAVASGSFTHIEYAVSTKVNEDGQTGRALNVRVGMRYRD